MFADEIQEAFEHDAIDEVSAYAELLAFPSQIGRPLSLPDKPEVAFRIAHSALTQASEDSVEIRNLDRRPLTMLYGDEPTARDRVRHMCAKFDEERWERRLARWRISTEAARATLEAARRSVKYEQEGPSDN